MAYIAFCTINADDLPIIEQFLKDKFKECWHPNYKYRTYYRKLACLYDFLKNGWSWKEINTTHNCSTLWTTNSGFERRQTGEMHSPHDGGDLGTPTKQLCDGTSAWTAKRITIGGGSDRFHGIWERAVSVRHHGRRLSGDLSGSAQYVRKRDRGADDFFFTWKFR